MIHNVAFLHSQIYLRIIKGEKRQMKKVIFSRIWTVFCAIMMVTTTLFIPQTNNQVYASEEFSLRTDAENELWLGDEITLYFSEVNITVLEGDSVTGEDDTITAVGLGYSKVQVDYKENLDSETT